MKDFKIESRLFDSDILSFSIPATDRRSELISDDYIIDYGTERYYVKQIRKVREDNGELWFEVEAEIEWMRFADKKLIGTTIVKDTVQAGFVNLLNPYGYSVAYYGTDTTEYLLELTDASVLDLVWSWAALTGVEIKWYHPQKLLYVDDQIGIDRTSSIRADKNLKSLKSTEIPPRATRLYALGKEDLDFSGVNGGLPYIEDYSYYTGQGLTLQEAQDMHQKDELYNDSSIADENVLLSTAQNILARLSQPLITYQASVLELSEILGVREEMELGDRVTVIDSDLNINATARITRTVVYPYEPQRNTLELSFSPVIIPSKSATNARDTGDIWEQFLGPVNANFSIRNDSIWTVARIPLRFRNEGKAHHHLDLRATGVGAGTMNVEIYDAEVPGTVYYSVDVPYTDGEVVQAQISFGMEELDGETDFRVRVTTTATGGPSATLGVDLDQSVVGPPVVAPYWIMATRAVKQTPTAANSIRYNYVSDAAQTFVVPDNVEFVEIEAVGARGGNRNGAFNAVGGNGTKVVASYSVIPGTVYDVYAPSTGGDQGDAQESAPGWPGGGTGGDVVDTRGHGGGGYAAVIAQGGSLASALIVAPGGGGSGENGLNGASGGDSGFFVGQDAPDHGSSAVWTGKGATQYAGGAAGVDASDNPTPGSFGQGGNGGTSPNAFHEGGGGGGGGWYGGGGGAGNNVGSRGGGGGTGMIQGALEVIEIDNASNSADAGGYVEFRWEDPVL